MGIAALILGIVSGIVSLFPFCGIVAFLPATIGVILGIIDIVIKANNKQPKGISIAGTIISVLSVVFIIIYNLIWLSAIASSVTDNSLEYDDSEYNESPDYIEDIPDAFDNYDINYDL